MQSQYEHMHCASTTTFVILFVSNKNFTQTYFLTQDFFKIKFFFSECVPVAVEQRETSLGVLWKWQLTVIFRESTRTSPLETSGWVLWKWQQIVNFKESTRMFPSWSIRSLIPWTQYNTKQHTLHMGIATCLCLKQLILKSFLFEQIQKSIWCCIELVPSEELILMKIVWITPACTTHNNA